MKKQETEIVSNNFPVFQFTTWCLKDFKTYATA